MAGGAIAALARPSGGLAMVAMDQRGSLRTMLEQARGSASDAELVRFKVAVARVLGPDASALLLDLEQGVRPALAAGALPRGCALIVAADRLEQPPGGVVTDTGFDEAVDPAAMRALGASGLKLLVIWRDDRARERRREMVDEFVARCARARLASIVEGVVRPREDGAPFDREDAILEAARELGAACDLYKCEVPYGGRASDAEITRRCAEITAALPGPWVVLSQGVAIDEFPRAVAAACAGGASGFLAGRAIWSDLVGSAEDLEERLRAVALPRLRALAALVDDAMAARAR